MSQGMGEGGGYCGINQAKYRLDTDTFGGETCGSTLCEVECVSTFAMFAWFEPYKIDLTPVMIDARMCRFIPILLTEQP